MRICYFIVYSAVMNNQAISGNVDVSIDGHVTSMEVVRRIEREIESNNKLLSQVVITNWRRFE